MEHGLSMQPDHVDLRAPDAVVVQEAGDRIAVRRGDRGFDVGERGQLGLSRVGDDLEQPVPHGGVVRIAAARARPHDRLAIRLDHGHIDGVHRRAAHHAYRAI